MRCGLEKVSMQSEIAERSRSLGRQVFFPYIRLSDVPGDLVTWLDHRLEPLDDSAATLATSRCHSVDR